MTGTDQWCTAEVVAAVTTHMNDDHSEDCALLCRSWGGQPNATEARMTGMDPEGLDLLALVDGAEVPVRVPFARRLAARAEVRTEVARLCHDAADRISPE